MFNKQLAFGRVASNLKNAGSKFRSWLLVAACGLVGFGAGLVGANISGQDIKTGDTASQIKVVSSESQLIAQIAKETGQSVVSIDVESQSTATDIFGFSSPQTEAFAGTGFIISDDGIIVTNRHVVPSGTSSVSVTLADGTQYDSVQVLGRTNTGNPLDVAFLKISDLKGKKLVPVKLGDSAKVQVGDRVVAIGNALGQFQNTVTSGIISGYGRDVTASDSAGQAQENLTDLFQTDAAINEGNSGGPLVNVNGEVIGINTAVAGGAQNIGFAIPINDVKGLISGVLSKGRLEQPFLGIRYVSLTPDLAYQYNLDIDEGAYILPSRNGSSIVPDSPAAKAGLQEKDVIIKVNDKKIDSKNGLTSVLSQFKVGDSVKLMVNRDGKVITFQATLAEAPQQ